MLPDNGGTGVPAGRMLVRWLCLVLLAGCIVFLVRYASLEPWLGRLESWLATWGDAGPILFALIYVAAVLLLVPGSALTIMAGALFGRVIGTLIVSLASTTGAALAFLISRYLARRRVIRWLQRHPRLAALHRAIGEGGWKIVALLRLSPLVPFNLQNYFYGATSIRFWSCILASWLAMLPGTFLYVSIGAMGREGLQAAAGERQRTPAEWTLLIAGLLATLAVTVYLTRLARRALARHE
jgi:uncharacterized membrane protein YdjX (TVP38/TMEM64 family)